MDTMQSNVEEAIEYRQLVPDELDAWAELCRVSFSAKQNAPSKKYFLDHVHFDPKSASEQIFVAVLEGEFIGTVRLFDRTMWNSGNKLSVFGVGEVCTLMLYRRKGICTKLFQVSLEYARRKCYQLTSLHAALQFRPFYQRIGYQTVTTQWIRFLIRPNDIHSLQIDPCNCMSFQPNDHAEVMAVLNTSVSKLFTGPVLKTEAYISSWVQNESKGNAVGFFQKDDSLCSYVIIGIYPEDCIQLKDFGATDSLLEQPERCKSILFSMLNWWIVQFNFCEQLPDGNKKSVLFSMPQPLANLLSIGEHDTDESFLDFTAPRESFVDEGWMYMPLESSSSGGRAPPVDCSKHVFWPIDNF